MQILKKGTKIDFMGKRQLALIFSAVVLLIAIGSLGGRGLALGIDFTGGTLIELGYQNDANISQIRQTLVQGGFGDASVQQFGTSKEVLIRLAQDETATSAQLSDKVFSLLSADATNPPELRRVEFVGPQVGDELTEDGALAVIVALSQPRSASPWPRM